MTGDNKSKLYIIFLTVFIDMVGFGIVIPILPLYAKHFDATPFQNGWLVGIYSAVQLFSAPWLGQLSDRFGRRPVLLFSVLGSAIGFFIMGWAKALSLLFVARIIDGFSGGNISTAQAYIADITEPHERSKSMALIGVAFGLGFIFGPAIGGIFGHLSVAAPFYFAGAMCLLNVALVYFYLPESLHKDHRQSAVTRGPIREVFRHGQNASLLVFTYFMVIAGFSIMTANYALFANQRFGFNAAQNGYLMAFVGVVGVIMQGGVLRRMLRKKSERSIALIGCVFLILGLLTLPLSHSILVLLLTSAIVGVGNSFLSPVLNGLSSRNTDPRWQGRMLGVMQGAGSLGRFVGPVFGGWLLMHDTPETFGRAPFWAGAVIVFVAMFFLSRLPKGKGPAVGTQPVAGA